jgi:hypothetical protein
MTKSTLYARLTAATPAEQIIMKRANNLKELKIELCETMNKYSTIQDQICTGASQQYYNGFQYGFMKHSNTCAKILTACNNLALKMNYELYSVNGFYFIKSK